MDLTQTDFEKFFNPASVALVGVSTGDYKFGGTSFLMKLQEGGFRGKLYPINPKAKVIRGIKAYPDLFSLPEVPDLAIVCVAARFVPSILEDCARIAYRVPGGLAKAVGSLLPSDRSDPGALDERMRGRHHGLQPPVRACRPWRFSGRGRGRQQRRLQ